MPHLLAPGSIVHTPKQRSPLLVARPRRSRMRRWKLPPQRNESFHLSDKARRTAGEEEQERRGASRWGCPTMAVAASISSSYFTWASAKGSVWFVLC